MKMPFEKEPHFDMEAHSEMYFENGNIFLEK
jgi:hypothetical protein